MGSAVQAERIEVQNTADTAERQALLMLMA
jgi:hypothetical protein